MNNRCAKRKNGHAKGSIIVPFKGTASTQKEQQLFHSKEQHACKRNNNCSIQRNNRHTKGTTIVLFKGTIGAQKEHQLFHSKEQYVRKRKSRRVKETTIVSFLTI
jgi:hypothetical protein